MQFDRMLLPISGFLHPATWVHPGALCPASTIPSGRLSFQPAALPGAPPPSPGTPFPHLELQRQSNTHRTVLRMAPGTKKKKKSSQRLCVPSTYQACESLPVFKVRLQRHSRCPFASRPPHRPPSQNPESGTSVSWRVIFQALFSAVCPPTQGPQEGPGMFSDLHE